MKPGMDYEAAYVALRERLLRLIYAPGPVTRAALDEALTEAMNAGTPG